MVPFILLLMVPILSAFTTNHFSIKDFFHFILESALSLIATLISWLALISSLYSQISLWKKQCPLQLKLTLMSLVLIEIFTTKLFNDLLLSSVKDIIFYLMANFFSQIDGVGMGNPLGPTFTKLFLCYHETN